MNTARGELDPDMLVDMLPSDARVILRTMLAPPSRHGLSELNDPRPKSAASGSASRTG
ncbi:hypothetical protein [uncultured Piscinibacter sp.]|uniref:hypothetical protein n=1 Tax=uncultured Piscinibacter sp. TaxID=1131835 RepID=UPI002620C05A|nr:hypothetical protein [uncultured Piscinibacter sp.]